MLYQNRDSSYFSHLFLDYSITSAGAVGTCINVWSLQTHFLVEGIYTYFFFSIMFYPAYRRVGREEYQMQFSAFCLNLRHCELRRGTQLYTLFNRAEKWKLFFSPSGNQPHDHWTWSWSGSITDVYFHLMNIHGILYYFDIFLPSTL